MKKWFALLSVLVVLSVLVTACGARTPQAPAVQPTEAPAPTTAPAEQPTQAPALEPTKAPEQPAGGAGQVVLWHGWTGAEADKLAEVIKAFQAANPGVTISPLAVPFDQLKNKFTTEASTGGGPDLLIGPKDWIGELSQAGLIQPLDGMADQIGLTALNQGAVDANKFQGKVWAFPESTEAMALWYNKKLVDTPATSVDELLQQATKVGLAFNQGFYQAAGVLLAEGGKVFVGDNQCGFTTGNSVIDGLTIIKNAKGTPNVVMDSDGSKLDAAFKDGKVGYIFNGPWATGDYAKALGAENLGVVDPITIGSGKFAPFLGTKNIFLAENTQNLAGAQAFLKFMSTPETQRMMTEVGHIPSNPDVKTNDPLIAGFLTQTKSSSYFPNEPEMGAVWTPAGDMITKVIEGKAEPKDAIIEACKLIDSANNKQSVEPTMGEGTAAGAAAMGEMPAAEGTLTLWHGWTGAEADKLAEVIKAFNAKAPNVKVDLLAVPFDQLKNKFTTEASTGGGPDLLIGPKDWIGELSQAGLIQPLDDIAGKIGLTALNQGAVDANKFEGKVWAFPESTEAMALWYNKKLVDTPAASIGELLQQATKVGLAFNQGFYQAAGVLLAQGGKVFVGDNQCGFTTGNSVIDGLTIIKNAKGTPNVVMDSDGSKLDAAFKDGKVGYIFNGPWATGDYAKALGAENLGVVDPITIGSGKFAPFLGTKNIFLAENTQNLDAAEAFMWFMAQPDTQRMMTEVGHIPSNPDVKTDDVLIAGFLNQTKSSSYFPNEPEMGAVWTPAGDMITKVIEGKAEPQAAAEEACKLINAANNK